MSFVSHRINPILISSESFLARIKVNKLSEAHL